MLKKPSIFRMPKLIAVFAGLAILLAAATALADALVVVEVRAGEGVEIPPGEVRLQAGDQTFSCRVEDSGCRIDAVPGGRYRVHFAPDEGEATRPQTTMIPSSGTVQLVVPYRPAD